MKQKEIQYGRDIWENWIRHIVFFSAHSANQGFAVERQDYDIWMRDSNNHDYQLIFSTRSKGETHSQPKIRQNLVLFIRPTRRFFEHQEGVEIFGAKIGRRIKRRLGPLGGGNHARHSKKQRRKTVTG